MLYLRKRYPCVEWKFLCLEVQEAYFRTFHVFVFLNPFINIILDILFSLGRTLELLVCSRCLTWVDFSTNPAACVISIPYLSQLEDDWEFENQVIEEESCGGSWRCHRRFSKRKHFCVIKKKVEEEAFWDSCFLLEDKSKHMIIWIPMQPRGCGLVGSR